MKPKPYNILLINPNPMRDENMPRLHEAVREYFVAREKIGTEKGDQRQEPNNGLLSIGRELLSRGYSVKYLDLNALEAQLFQKEAKYFTANEIEDIVSENISGKDCVLLSSLTCSFGTCSRIANIVKGIDETKKIILGGIFPTMNTDYCIKNGKDFDAIVIGEGEWITPKLVRYFETGHYDLLIDEKGFALKHKGKFRKVHGHNIIADLDKIEIPAFELVDPQFPPAFRLFSIRGCSSRCSFCAPSFMWRHKIRRQSPEKTVSVIRRLKEDYNAEYFVMGDLTFFDDEEHSRNVLKGLIKADLGMNFWCQTRLDRIKEENLGLLKKAGCDQIAIGIESYNNNILKLASKGIHVEDMVSRLVLAKQHGFQVQGYFIVGLPWENASNIERTIRFIEHSVNSGYLDLTHVSIYVPYPGLPLTDKIKIIDHNYSHYYQGVFLDMPPKPVHETRYLSSRDIVSLWERLLRHVTRSYEKRSEIRVDAGYEMSNKGLSTEEIILGTDALTVAGQVRQESEAGSRKSVFNIAQGIKNKKNAYVSNVINEDDKYVVGFAEVYNARETELIVEAVDGTVDIIQLDIDRKNNRSKEIIKRAFSRTKRSEIYTYSDFETLFKSILYIIQNEKEKGLYQQGMCIFPENKCSVRLADFLANRGYDVTLFLPGQKINMKEYGVLIAFCLDEPLIDENLMGQVQEGTLIIDASLASIKEDGLFSKAKRKDIIFRRPDIRSIILSELYLIEHYHSQTASSKGRKILGDFGLVSGGVVGEDGDVVVDNVNKVKRVFGIADGKGKVKQPKNLSEKDKENLAGMITKIEENTPE